MLNLYLERAKEIDNSGEQQMYNMPTLMAAIITGGSF